jgi:HEAT repeat protein
VSPARLAGLVADLDDHRFAVREQAARELLELGERAEQPLRRALAWPASVEVRRRVAGLLENVHGPLVSCERLRRLRALEVLEQAGTADARRLLEVLAGGAPAARLTREAKGALRRLDRLHAQGR